MAINLDNLFNEISKIDLTDYEIHVEGEYITHYTINKKFVVDGREWHLNLFYIPYKVVECKTIGIHTKDYKIDIAWENMEKFQNDLKNRTLSSAGVNGMKV